MLTAQGEVKESDAEFASRVRYHEAGHAAVALHLGFTLSEVSVVTEGLSGGHVTPASHKAGTRSAQAFWDKAIMACAGAAAEEKFCGNVGAVGIKEDMRVVHTICSALETVGFESESGASTCADLAAEAQQLADHYVEMTARQIQALRDTLEASPQIDGKTAAEIFDRATSYVTV